MLGILYPCDFPGESSSKTMKSFGSVLLALSALAARGDAASTPQEKGSAESVNCVDDFNVAREQAGLEPFVEETKDEAKMPITNEKYIEAVCKAMQGVETVDNDAENIRRSGTYAYAPQTDSEKGCAAAVSYWKEAHVKLGNLPPVYEGNTDVYAESRSRSLVALYSAKDDATISCAYITCPVSITNTTTVSTPTEPTDGGEEEEEDPPNEETPPLGREGEPESQPKTGPTARRLSTSSETITGLVCLTNPPALVQGEKPFSEEVWAGIKEAIENSASASTQSALLVTALLVFTPFIIL